MIFYFKPPKKTSINFSPILGEMPIGRGVKVKKPYINKYFQNFLHSKLLNFQTKG